MKALNGTAKVLAMAVLVPAIALPVGCAQFSACGFGWNVRGHPKDGLQDGYEDGAVYELQQDVFIMASDTGVERKEGYLVPPSSKKAPPRIFPSPATMFPIGFQKSMWTSDSCEKQIDRVDL